MKKRIYSLVLALVLLLSLCPVAALAEETEEYTGEPVATSEPLEAEPIAEPTPEPEVTPEPEPEPEPATEPEATETPVEQPEATEAPAEPEPEPTAEPEATEAPVEDPEPETDDAAAAVEMMIDALPELSALDTMAADERDAAYFAAQDAADAYYALSDEQQARVANLDALIALLDWFSAQVEAMDDTVDTSWYSADSSSFSINSAAQLMGLASLVNGGTTFEGKTVTLTADIDLDGYTWTPIGSSRQFYGTFDGGNYTISNLTYNGNGQYVGLFGQTNGATVKNVVLTSASVTVNVSGGNLYAGGIVGLAMSSTIQNCCFSGTINASATKSYSTEAYAGGIVGHQRDGAIECCGNTGSVSATANVNGIGYRLEAHAYAGGIAGVSGAQSASVKIQNCYSIGSVSATGNEYGGSKVGGIAGSASVVSNCYYLERTGLTDSKAEAATEVDFKSGKVTYLLNDGNTTDPVWRQTCGQGYPEISSDSSSSKIVYQSAPCPSYSNKAGVTKAHDFENYTCKNCGEKQHHHCLYGHESCTETHDEVVFEKWTSGNSLPDTAGYYYLGQNVSFDNDNNPWKPEDGTVICLNGHTITFNIICNESAISLNSGVTFTLTDCGTSGKVTNQVNGYSHGVDVQSGAIFNLYGGTITGWGLMGVTFVGKTSRGGGVWNAGTFNMYGGTITNCAACAQGGGVYNSGSFTMYGGKITGNGVGHEAGQPDNDPPARSGGGVYNSGSFTMYGGTITGNHTGIRWQSVQGRIYTTDAVQNVYLPDGKTITVGENFTGSVGVTAENEANGTQVLTLNNGASTNNFTYDKKTYTIDAQGKLACAHMNTNGDSLFSTETHKCSACGEDCTHTKTDGTSAIVNGACTCCQQSYALTVTCGSETTGFDSFEAAVTKFNSYTNNGAQPAMTLYSDCTISSTTSPVEITRPGSLNLNGKKITGNLTFNYNDAHNFTVGGSGSFEGNVTLQGSAYLYFTGSEGQKVTGTLTVSGAKATVDLYNDSVSVKTLSLTSGTAKIGRGTVESATVSGGTANVSSTGKVSTLNVTSGTVNVSGGTVEALNVSGGAANVTGGTVASLQVKTEAAVEQTSLSGGSYGNISISTEGDQTEKTVADLLAAGYAYRSGNSLLTQASLKNTTSLSTVAVVKCEDHSIKNGACEYCGTAMAASVTNNNTVTYYEDLKAAFDAVPVSDAVTVTLLNNINQDNWRGAQEDGTGQRQIDNSRTFTLDLNGKTIAVELGSDDVSLCNAILTIKDSSDGNGKIEDILCVDDPASLTVQSGAFAGLRACGGAVVLQGGGYGQILFGTGDSRTIGDLLGNGYGYYYTDKPSTGGPIWLTDLTATSCQNVAVAALPITGVTLTSDKTNNTLTYGETVTLTATVSLASGYVSDSVTYSWCEVVNRVEKGIQGQQRESYSPTSPSAGKHTYRVKATVDGYTVNGDITVTVNKASVTVTQAPAAEENLTYNGTAQALVTGGTATGGSIEYSLDQTNWNDSVPTGKDAGQYTVYWREKARDTNHTANTTVHTISVGIAPATLTLSVTIKDKKYDGTTTATADSVTFTGLQNGEKLTKDTDYTVSAKFEDKNAGKNKTVTATVRLCETAMTKNYTLTGNTATTTANIEQKPIDVTVSVADKTYDGTNTATVTAEVAAKDLISGDSVTIAGVTGTFDNVNAGGNKSVTIYTDGKQVSGTGSANYDLKFPATATGRINKAEMSVENPPTAGTIENYNAEEQALVTAGVSANGTVYYSLDKKMWTYSVPTAKDAGEYTVYWYIQDTSGNYKDYGSKNEPKELSVTIAPRDINPPEAAVSPYIACEQDGTLTFNGKKQTPTFKLELKPRKEHGTSGVVDDALLETLVEGKDYTVDVAAQSNVGTYTATITGTGNYTGTLTREWSIGKAAAPTLDDVTAKHLYTAEGEATVSLKKILADGNVSAYTPGSLPQGVTNVSVDSDGTLHYTISGLTEADVDKTFTIPVTIQSQNYEDATVNVVVKVTKPSAIANLVQQVAGNAPHTGDSAMPVLYIVVIVLALGAIVALVVVRRKKK